MTIFMWDFCGHFFYHNPLCCGKSDYYCKTTKGKINTFKTSRILPLYYRAKRNILSTLLGQNVAIGIFMQNIRKRQKKAIF